jgi:hypothetical protein
MVPRFLLIIEFARGLHHSGFKMLRAVCPVRIEDPYGQVVSASTTGFRSLRRRCTTTVFRRRETEAALHGPSRCLEIFFVLFGCVVAWSSRIVLVNELFLSFHYNQRRFNLIFSYLLIFVSSKSYLFSTLFYFYSGYFFDSRYAVFNIIKYIKPNKMEKISKNVSDSHIILLSILIENNNQLKKICL